MPHLSSTECVEPSSSGDEVMEGDEERGDDCSSMLDESISISDIRQAQQGEEIVLLSPPLLLPYSPVPRLSFAHRFDTKLREMSFEKQNSAKAVLFTMYVSTAGAKTFYHRKT